MGFLDRFKSNNAKDYLLKQVTKLLHGSQFTYTSYDANNTTYIEKGYNTNPDVYAIINQQVQETLRIPFYIKRIEDNKEAKRYLQHRKTIKNGYDIRSQIKKRNIESKAFKMMDYDMPLERPNPLQSWSEFIALYKTYLPLTGNAYIWMVTPKEGANKGVPIEIYLLPSQLTQIVLKEANLIEETDVIDYYTIQQGSDYLKFDAEDVIHIKYANPNFDYSGSHLYGVSKLKAALKNIQSSNAAHDLNANTLSNGGVFGFISTKEPMTAEQAKSIKDRLIQMDKDPKRLSNIAGSSQEVVFTRISLTTDELKPFDYLMHDQKMICNVLGWDNKLLNNDGGAKFSNLTVAVRRAINSGVLPDLRMLENAFNEQILPRFKGYQNALFVFDESELPEMQQDLETLTKRLDTYLDNGIITRAEYREAISYAPIEDDNLNILTVSKSIQTLDDAINPLEPIEPLDNDTEAMA